MKFVLGLIFTVFAFALIRADETAVAEESQANCGIYILSPDKEWLGNDISTVEVKLLNDCCAACTANTGCKAWNWEPCKTLGCKAKCYLKSAALVQGDKEGSTAGKLSGNKPTTPGVPSAPTETGTPSAEAPNGKIISGGSIFLICFFIPVGLYFLAGTAYNYKQGDKEGLELLPNSYVWIGLFILIRDGFQFTWGKIKGLTNRGSSDY